MIRRGVPAAGVVACALALGACGAGSGTSGASGDVAGADPDAVGTATSVETEAAVVRVVFAPDAGYEYFESAVLTLGDEVELVSDTHAVGDIREGDRLRIWTDECAESFPVQCKVDAVEVLDLSP